MRAIVITYKGIEAAEWAIKQIISFLTRIGVIIGENAKVITLDENDMKRALADTVVRSYIQHLEDVSKPQETLQSKKSAKEAIDIVAKNVTFVDRKDGVMPLRIHNWDDDVKRSLKLISEIDFKRNKELRNYAYLHGFSNEKIEILQKAWSIINS